MPKKQSKQGQEQLVVSIRHVATPDADSRLYHAIDILLNAATRITTDHEDSVEGAKRPG